MFKKQHNIFLYLKVIMRINRPDLHAKRTDFPPYLPFKTDKIAILHLDAITFTVIRNNVCLTF